jgi:serine/threonine protein kinase
MSQSTNPGAEGPSATDPGARREHQDTLLLSDVPEASSLMPDAPRASTTTPNLPTLDLTPLTQRYDILAEAGHGSMGNVYKARDRETGETVALKLLKPEIASDQAMIERFKNELLYARKITHKNVCRVHEFNRIGGIAYTSMEFVEGESLRSVLNRFGGLPPRKATDLAVQICSGLQEAHAQGIVHRDLKPENVMIDTQGNVKIMDFGIARSMEAVTRLTGSMVGTPAYMAPEQVAGKAVDYRTDIYALGLILYEVFTGKPAFHAENAVAVALKQMRESPAPPHEIEPAIPVFIERAILKCLEKDPSKRFQSVKELKEILASPAAPAAPQPMPILASTHSSNSTPLAPHPLYGSSALGAAAPKRTSPFFWVLLGALLVIAASTAGHWSQIQKKIQSFSEPPPIEAPKPPDFALNPSTSQSDAAESDSQANVSQSDAAAPQPPSTPAQTSAPPAAAQPSTPAAARNDQPASSAAPPSPVAAPTPTVQPPPQKSTAAAAAATLRADRGPGNSASRDVERRADQAFGETEPVAQPPVNDHTPSYLWIGRFEREDRAQGTAKRIEDLGLTVAVIPRHGPTGKFFIVVTGPFGPERVESTMDWLRSQGFNNVRVVKNPMREEHQASQPDQNPNP